MEWLFGSCKQNCSFKINFICRRLQSLRRLLGCCYIAHHRRSTRGVESIIIGITVLSYTLPHTRNKAFIVMLIDYTRLVLRLEEIP